MQAEAGEVRCQGRTLSGSQLEWLRAWVTEHPHWSRKRLSRELCAQWDWRNGRGQLKDFAARSLLEKLEARRLLVLPPLQTQRSHPRPKVNLPTANDWSTESIGGPLSALEPLQWILPAPGSSEARRFAAYLRTYHYLGLRLVGENMHYLVRDQQGRDLACLLCASLAHQGPRSISRLEPEPTGCRTALSDQSDALSDFALGESRWAGQCPVEQGLSTSQPGLAGEVRTPYLPGGNLC